MSEKVISTITSKEPLEIIHKLREVTPCEEHLQEKTRKLLHEEKFLAWEFSPKRGDSIEHIKSSLKIRRVGFAQARLLPTIEVLRESWIGRVYRVRLKQYYIMHQLVHWVRHKGLPFYVNHIDIPLFNRRVKRWRQLIKLSEHVKRNGAPVFKVAESGIVETPKPSIFPACEQDSLISAQDQYSFPEMFVTDIKNAMVYGGTNLVLLEDEVICHDLYDFRSDYSSEELHGRTFIDPETNRIRWLMHDEAPEPVAVAAIFTDACAANYAHWMTEVMPRVVLFCMDERFNDVPIIIDDGLHENIMQSLLLVVGSDREIIVVSAGKALTVGELYITSPAGYVPFERRGKKLSGHSHGVFSPPAFEMLCKNLNGQGQNIKDNAWPEKIFIRRNSGVRKITNATELERLLVERGYVIVEPEKLTFTQQMQLFSNAKIIVGSAGAAWINLLFASENVRIFILISKYPDTSYWYWQNIACACKKTVSYVLGEINTGDSGGVHSDFMIDLESFSKALDEKLTIKQPTKEIDDEG